MARLKLFIFSLLLLQLTSSTKSVSPMYKIEPDPLLERNVEQGEASSSVKSPNHKTDLHASKNAEYKRMKKEMHAVNDNISAVYIVRGIEVRGTVLTASTANAIEKMYKLHGDSSVKIIALKKELKITNKHVWQAEIIKPKIIDARVQQQLLQIVNNNATRLEEKNEALDKLKQIQQQLEKNATIATRLKERREVVDELNAKLAEAERSQIIEERLNDHWMGKMNGSKLPDDVIKNLKEKLAGALIEEKEMESYLKEVNTHIEKLRKLKETAKIEEEKHPLMDECKLFHQLCVEHLDFVQQIRLEVQLHQQFKFKLNLERHYDAKNMDLPAPGVLNDFQALMENARNLEKLNEDILNVHKKALKKANRSPKLLNRIFFRNNRQKEVVKKSEAAFALYYEHPNHTLLDLNNAAKNLYMEMATVIKWPFNHEDKFVASTVDVAEIAVGEERRKDPYKIGANNLYKVRGMVTAKNYLECLFNMCSYVHSILSKLPRIWQKEIHDKIRKKLEMPREWYSEMHAKAFPNIQGKYEVTEEMVHIRVELLLAKMLLVYERLDKFYTIEGPYNVWKAGEMPEEMPYSSLKSYFDEFEQKKLTAVASSSDHGQHA